MTTRKAAELDIAKVLDHERFAVLWWDLELPSLGKMTPNQVWEDDPQKVLDCIESYKE